jgi:competence protein ComEA
VYEIDDNKRINDVIVLAGGFTQDIDFKSMMLKINRADKLTDGMKIFIPFKDSDPSILEGLTPAKPSSTVNGGINLNTASKDELNSLEGVGDVTAQKIIDNRPYKSIQDLVDKKIIGQSVFDKVKASVKI